VNGRGLRLFAAPMWSEVWRELRLTSVLSRILIAVQCIVLLALGGSLSQTLGAERQAREQIATTAEVLSLLQSSLVAGIDAETGQRGFLLAGEPEYLEPYERGSRIWLPTIERLRVVLGDEATPAQEEAMARLQQLAAARLGGLQRTIEHARAGAPAQVRDLAAGKRTMDRYRATVGALEREQTAKLRRAIIKAQRVEARTVPIIFLLGGTVFGLVIVGLWLERRAARAEAAARDTDRLREAHARSDLLARELNHRVKNLFAVIISIVSLSGKGETDVRTVVAKIRSRIHALSLAHSVSQGQLSGEEVALGEVIGAILRPYDSEEGRIRLHGDEVALPVRTVTPLGLLMHELATNSAKYGALSVGDGAVEVRWRRSAAKPGTEVELLWHETHGPTVAQDREAGFGSMLVEKATMQLSGRIERDWLPDGLCAKLVFPLEVHP